MIVDKNVALANRWAEHFLKAHKIVKWWSNYVKWRGETDMCKVSYEKEVMAIKIEDVPKITRDHCVQLYKNKLENLD